MMTKMTKLFPVISILPALVFGMLWFNASQDLAQKNTELADLKERYDKLLVEANSKIARLAEEANRKLQLANQPEIPVRVSFRKALLSSGNVASFHNVSGRSIALIANVERPSSGVSRMFNLTIDPGLSKELGEMEGWAFVSGDTITLAQPEHKSTRVQAP